VRGPAFSRKIPICATTNIARDSEGGEFERHLLLLLTNPLLLRVLRDSVVTLSRFILNLAPLRSPLSILQHDAGFGESIADRVGRSEIFAVAGRLAERD